MPRLAGIEETPAIAALLQRAFGEYRGRLVPETGALRETGDSLAEAMRAGGFFLIEVRDRDPIAALFIERRVDRFYIGRLAVDPDYRRQGLAQSLIAAAERMARAEGKACLELGVRIALPRNIALFERLGFRRLGARAHPGFDRPTWYVMEKALLS